ncbi:MAG: NAD-dependent epimerase/dehydratase family protein [Euryarchaeota archaeon]|nr:NAD-dependent epimerase/dehydratase family protein [Euryarchaeota archaeon]
MSDYEPDGRTILVTGGAGFIGSHIVDAVVDRNDVRVLDSLSTGSRENLHPDARLIEGDIRDEETLDAAMKGVDIVFHKAAMVSVPASVEQPTACHDINGTATLKLLEAARANDSRVIFASSAAIYGHPDELPIAEAAPKRPASPYGLEKLTADYYTRIYADRYGLETVNLRYFNVYGPRQTGGQYSGVISTFLDQARAGEPITVEGDGEQTRDFVHVEDVVQANLRAATADRTGTSYNIGTGSNITIRELAETVQRVTDTESEIVHTDPRPGDIDRSEADISKAREGLGYRPTVTVEDGLSQLVSSRQPSDS